MFVRNESEEQELSSLKTITDEFFKSIIQSEAEVRSTMTLSQSKSTCRLDLLKLQGDHLKSSYVRC